MGFNVNSAKKMQQNVVQNAKVSGIVPENVKYYKNFLINFFFNLSY